MPNAAKSANAAIIAGSAGHVALGQLADAVKLEPQDTPFGVAAPIYRASLGETDLFYLCRHGDTGYGVTAQFVNYRANIWALKELGVGRIVAWSGPGSIDPAIPIGEVLVPADIIDETSGRESTFFVGLGLGFVRQNPVFCPEIAAALRGRIAARIGHCRAGDVYTCTSGPRLETPAEIRKYAILGGSLVGMTLAPEAFLARELEMCYCPVCYITNYAEGVADRSYRPGVLFEGLLGDEEARAVDAAVQSLPAIAAEALQQCSGDPDCPCVHSMERYRRSGRIGDDWHTWIERH